MRLSVFSNYRLSSRIRSAAHSVGRIDEKGENFDGVYYMSVLPSLYIYRAKGKHPRFSFGGHSSFLRLSVFFLGNITGHASSDLEIIQRDAI